jgi:hypothetical protein
MQITQIFISDDDNLDNLLDYLKNNIELVKSFYPNDTYVLYNNKDIREFIQKHFEEDVLWAYDYLNPYSYKADLAKYCIVYILGGLYIDLGLKMNYALDVGDLDFIFFRDFKKHSNIKNTFSVCPGFMYSKPKNEIFKKCINQIIENCKNRYYGATALDPTGPVLLGKKIAESEPNLNCVIGDYIELTPDREYKNLAFVNVNGIILAFSKGLVWFSDLSKNTNNYTKIYQDKEVYGDKISGIQYLYKHYLLREADEGGLQHYLNMPLNLVEDSILSSEEYAYLKIKKDSSIKEI